MTIGVLFMLYCLGFLLFVGIQIDIKIIKFRSAGVVMAGKLLPRILVADDDALYRLIFEEAFDEAGLDYKIVDGGSQAIMELIASPNSFDCIILDIYMERLDGVETGHVVRRLNQDIPIIMITGDQKRETEEKARCVGISDFMRKPFSHEEIQTTVRRVLNMAGEKKALTSA